MPGITEGLDPGWERGFPRQNQATLWGVIAGGGGEERDGGSGDCMGLLGSSADGLLEVCSPVPQFHLS